MFEPEVDSKAASGAAVEVGVLRKVAVVVE
jgi:hypothetical protein